MKIIQVSVGLFVVAAIVGQAGASTIEQQPAGPPTTAAAEVTQCAQAQMVVDQLLAAATQRLDAARQSNAAADLRAAVDSLQTTIRDARAQLAPCATTQPAVDPHAGHTMTPAAPSPAKPPASAPMEHSKMQMGTTPAAPAGGYKPTPPAPMDHSKMPMGAAPTAKPSSGAKPAPTAPMDHSKMPMGSTPAKPSPATKPPAAAPMDHSKMDHAAMDHGTTAAPADAAKTAVDPVCGLKVNPSEAPNVTQDGKTHYFCSQKHRDLFQKNPSKYLPKGK